MPRCSVPVYALLYCEHTFTCIRPYVLSTFHLPLYPPLFCWHSIYLYTPRYSVDIPFNYLYMPHCAIDIPFTGTCICPIVLLTLHLPVYAPLYCWHYIYRYIRPVVLLTIYLPVFAPLYCWQSIYLYLPRCTVDIPFTGIYAPLYCWHSIYRYMYMPHCTIDITFTCICPVVLLTFHLQVYIPRCTVDNLFTCICPVVLLTIHLPVFAPLYCWQSIYLYLPRCTVDVTFTCIIPVLLLTFHLSVFARYTRYLPAHVYLFVPFYCVYCRSFVSWLCVHRAGGVGGRGVVWREVVPLRRSRARQEVQTFRLLKSITSSYWPNVNQWSWLNRLSGIWPLECSLAALDRD